MKWVITNYETKDTDIYKNVVTRVFFNVYADEKTEFFFSGDALLAEPISEFVELGSATQEDMLRWLFYSIGESAIAFYKKNSILAKNNKKK
jgi:hypothetical protein